MGAERRMSYALADDRERFGLASRNPDKDKLIISDVLACHPGAHALVIGHYVGQLARIAERIGAPLITGKTPRYEREGALWPRRHPRHEPAGGGLLVQGARSRCAR